MSLSELRAAFTEYFGRSGYKQVNASSLIPQNDPSVLFTTAGMQQFKEFYKDPSLTDKQLVTTVQPVVRTTDIAEVGDDTHLTLFEMLGNFRFDQVGIRQMKEEAIQEAWQFIESVLDVDKSRIYATVFAGDDRTPPDTDSENVWRSLGVTVKKAGREENFWGPTGSEGPCGPTTEIYIDDVEVWNLVFNEFDCSSDGKFTPLKSPGLDTGSGLERLSTTLQQKKSIWEIEPFSSWTKLIPSNDVPVKRVIIDHLRASIFLISAGVRPANKGREYVLRRLIRKAAFLTSMLPETADWEKIIGEILSYYNSHDLLSSSEINEIISKERRQFEINIIRASNYLEKWMLDNKNADEKTVTELAFYMYESFGFPKEMVVEYLADNGWQVNTDHFEQLFKKHQEVSRAGVEKQFKGGLADHSEETTKHHTAHHLLLAALREVLGEGVVQRGSNVTKERLRIDFSFDRKLTDEEINKVEGIVNEKIKENIPVEVEEMELDLALKTGAMAEFGTKYGNVVTVYSIGDFSKELCGGPHAKSTGQLGTFKVLKEEASSNGVRRIKAKLN